MLHIRRVVLSNLATHRDTDVALPNVGLVAVTGSNGAGKSTLLEAVATACWGESLRGEMPWRDGQAGSTSVHTDAAIITRKRSKAGSAKVEWTPLEGDAVTYETSTKAQTALEAVIGSYDVWRRTCVLSSLDSAAFSLARDSDRKRLLEEFLGLGMFDVALDACRKDKKAASNKAQQAESERTEINLRLSFAQSQLEQAKKDQAALLADTAGKDADSLKEEGRRMVSLLEAANRDVEAAVAKVRELEHAGLAEDAKAQAESARLSKMSKDSCPTCGQSVADMKAHLAAEIAKIKKEAAAKKAAVATALEAAKDEWAELAEEQAALKAKVDKLREDYRLAESQIKQRQSLADRREKAEADVAAWSSKTENAASRAANASQEAATLDAVEQVLGLRGVRSQVLDHALSALESNANAWLSRMPTESGILSLSLSGATTQKSGSVVDAISLKVRGRPYASCSGGERRRVDVALLLALRELAVAAHGRDGSLLCDEVFDALDSQGQADVATALAEMAQDRLVLVVTHSPELVKALRPVQHLHVSLEDGAAKVTAR